MPETIVITRPKADAQKLAKELIRKGFNCLVEPVLSIRTLYSNADALEYALERKPQAILATSKHAITALAHMTDIRSIPIVTVGRATADHAKKSGFRNIAFASGNAHSLIAYTESNYAPENGRILYIRGKEISVDLALRLMHNGFMVDSVTLYKTEKAKALSKKLCQAMLEKEINAVLFFSKNTAMRYAELASKNNVETAHRNITALCMSRQIADKAAELLPWKGVSLFPDYIKNSL